MQAQANFINAPVVRPTSVETTAVGAAYLAGLAVGYWKDTEDIQANWAVDRIFEPDIDNDLRKEQIEGWHKAVERSFG